MSAPPPSEKKPRRESGYERFESGLLEGVIAPGQFLSQREIGALTGLTERAARELILRLEADGLLVATPGRGFQAASVDLSLIREAFQLRRLFECEAVKSYCLKAAATELAARREAHEAVLAEATPTPSRALRERSQEADRGLHEAIIAALDNSLIAAIYRVNAIKIRLIRRTQIRLDRFMALTMREHLAILSACEARDEAAAAAAMAAHIDNTMRRVMGQE